MKGQPYRDRREAGRVLASHLSHYAAAHPVVLALPRGGVPVAFEVAAALDAPLDVFVVRKLGVPGHEEFAMGAIASGGVEVLNEPVVEHLGITRPEISAVAQRELHELERREALYRAERPAVDVRGRVVVLVDDGLATGSSMRAAIRAIRELRVRRLVVAVPVGATETCDELSREVDALVCPLRPEPFQAVGLWYADFSPTSDEEVRECLAIAASRTKAVAGR